jgi:Skp family chaperone for outer membrane proteins
MKSFLTILGAAAIVMLVAAPHTRTAGVSVVTVSARRIATESNAGKRASQELNTLKGDRERDLTAKQKELEGVVKQLAAAGLAPADRDRLTQDEARRRAELQQLTRQAQTDLQAAQTKLENELRVQVTPIVADIAKRYGVEVVLNSDTAVVWAAPGTDATEEVIHQLNAAP